MFIVESHSRPGTFHTMTFFKDKMAATCTCEGATCHKTHRWWTVGTKSQTCRHLTALKAYMKPFLEEQGLTV